MSALGIRAQESARRAAMLEIDDDEEWGGYAWRPLLTWTVEDVIVTLEAMIKAHGSVPLRAAAQTDS